jgi:hypothetical protein
MLRNSVCLESAQNLSEQFRDFIFIGDIWIDAICINQRDLEERAPQVHMMDRVYSQVLQVIVWLGPLDATTHTALHCISKLADVSYSRASE